MQVQQILNSKEAFDVITVVPGSSVSAAAKLLSSKRIGAVIVSPDGKACAGILSERDIVRELGRKGAACMDDTVDSLMTKDPVTCTRGDDSDDVFRKMTDGRFRHLPVVEDNVMIGLISIGDVVKARLSELAMEKDALEGMIMGR
ncbi:CBS domain-containing protein [Pseudoruegeria sp. SK021]|uniref:CBS domain-containing protein n=1 Tax=Pseudoruegeria sp. SK021 TaxID=1933035 RepID=UPI000A2264CA|nr:CBS domain-containing protein [Pseudoruegeria sp. SK021]OSP55520.1 histidine kinase [Pseudoruegeria sp. SK021]